MATEYLDAGAKTFAASAWSGSGLANGNDYIVDVGFGPITGGLDQSALTGIESLYFKNTSNGIVGGGSSGSLLIDADATADAYISNYGNVTLYASGAVTEFSCGPGSTNFLTGGAFGNVVIDGGTVNFNESTSITGEVYINSGIVSVEYNAANATSMQINGGNVTLKRAPTILTINDGTVTLDPDSAEEYTSKTLNLNGGRLIMKGGSYPTANLDGGVLDLRLNNRDLVLGATAGKTSSACRIYGHPNADLSGITPRSSSKVNVGGAIPFP